MLMQRLALVAMLGLFACRDDAKPASREPMPGEPTPAYKEPAEMTARLASWRLPGGRTLADYAKNPPVHDPLRELSPAELVAIAYRFHPQLGDPETYTIEEFDKAFWYSKEQLALAKVQEAGYERLDEWQALCRAVRKDVPPDYIVAERTYPRYFPTYMLVVDGPPKPSSIPGVTDEFFLVVHASYLVPYYFYYELHSRRIGGRIHRDPLLYEVTPVFKDVLAVIEREIRGRYGYRRMSPEVAGIEVPGIHVNGYHDWDKHPPTLQDALFTPQRW